MLCAPDLAQMINEFEGLFEVYSETTKQLHELSFQRHFCTDVQRWNQNFVVIPFERYELTAVKSTDVVFDDYMYHNIQQLEVVGAQLN